MCIWKFLVLDNSECAYESCNLFLSCFLLSWTTQKYASESCLFYHVFFCNGQLKMCICRFVIFYHVFFCHRHWTTQNMHLKVVIFLIMFSCHWGTISCARLPLDGKMIKIELIINLVRVAARNTFSFAQSLGQHS